jgi:uncharacterized membrane protein
MDMPGFPERGDKTTRLEAFVDAAFAFALTLLAIAGDHIPASGEELWSALRGLPAYAASFLLIVRFWTGHANWSRRYGLDDATTRRLSLLLVFLVLVFVYPMRIVFAVLFASLSNGFFPANFAMTSFRDVSLLFITFGVAFGSLGAVMALLYGHAWRERDRIGLDARERIELRMAWLQWALIPMVAVLSIVLALLIPATRESAGGWLLGLPGFIYFSLNIATLLVRRSTRRRLAMLPVEA